jgi:TolB-like protein/Tfp pilus assembly protein PilF
MDELIHSLKRYRDKIGDGPRATRKPAHRSNLLFLLGVIIIIALAVFVWKSLYTSKTEAIDSVVVLPLDNLIGDPEQGYFVDGMTEMLTAIIAQNSSLKVISRTSAMRYRNTEKSLPEIASELGVKAVIEGSVFRSGDQVRVTVQLIDARNDAHIWSNSYVGDIRDALFMQEEISQAIFEEIHARLTPEAEHDTNKVRQIDSLALESYLKGRFLLNKRTRSDDLQESVTYFEKVIELEPEYAPAYAALASSYELLAERASRTAHEQYLKAKQLALRALELDNRNSEALAILAATSYIFEWNWSESGRYFQQALSISPNNAMIHQRYAEYLRCVGQFDKALLEIERAQELSPMLLMTQAMKAWILMQARRYEDSMAQCKITVLLDENFVLPYLIASVVYILQGKYDEAMKWEMKAIRLNGISEEEISEFNDIYRAEGYVGYLKYSIDKMIKNAHDPDYLPWYALAIKYTWIGEVSLAIECLEKAADERSFFITPLAVDPLWDSLRSDPKFNQLLDRMRLRKYAVKSMDLEDE